MVDDNDFTADFSEAFYYRWYYPLIVLGIFCVVFSAVFGMYQDKGESLFNEAADKSPLKEYTTAQTTIDSWNSVKNFGILSAIIVGIIITGIVYLLAGVVALTPFRKFTVALPLIVLITYSIIFFIGLHLTYAEPQNYVIGNAIIFGFGIPLYITAFIMTFFNMAILVLAIAKIVLGDTQ